MLVDFNCKKKKTELKKTQNFVFIGVYISKTTYIRQGEQSLDGFYRAWHQVEYYRYNCSKLSEWKILSLQVLVQSISSLVTGQLLFVAFTFIHKMTLSIFLQFCNRNWTQRTKRLIQII